MDKTAIAKKIIHYRKLKGMTQEALSELTGLNVRTIQRIESGGSRSQTIHIEVNCRCFKCQLGRVAA